MIVVTGMHRSGTSFLCQLLAAVGVEFGASRSWLPADEWNERGYYEATDVLDLNSVLLTGFPRSKGRLKAAASQVAYLALPGPKTAVRRARRRRLELERVAAGHAGEAVKDPRFCLTLGCWLEVAEIESVVVCLRHPQSVAHSLWRRQRVPRWVALRFWSHHMNALLSQLPLDRSVPIRFEHLQDPELAPEQLELLRRGLSLTASPEDMVQARAQTFSARLVHAVDWDPLPAYAAKTWARLEEWAEEYRGRCETDRPARV